MRKQLITAVCVLAGFCTKAQTNYDSAKIPENLSKNAAVVVRLEESDLEIKGPGAATYKYKVAITIMNKAGDGFAEVGEVYDKFSSLYNIKATIYDGSGKKIKDYKSSDILDHSLISDFSIFEDNRVKIIPFSSNSYPYTIEYSYASDYKGLLSFPSWRPVPGFDVAVEKSTYTIRKKAAYQFKYLTSANLKTDSVATGDEITYKWACTNFAPLEREPMASGISNVTPWVNASPNEIEYDNTTGNFNNWQNFGAWIYKLNEGGNKLPEATKAKVQALIKDAKTPKEKVRILYNYLQQNTRYVSVQLGIGGFRPILAEKVAQVNYGDCKALSNYMKALLNEAGIASNLIIIGNGKPELDEKYASIGQANHMILCVPLANDTTFLECTSQHVPMGFIGYGNSDRNVLMITENGGKIVRTPIYSAKDNYQIRKADVNFVDGGNASIDIKTLYGNAQFEDNFSMLFREPSEQRKAVIQDNDIPGAELVDFKYEQADKSLPVLSENIRLKNAQLFTTGGDKVFLTLNILNRRESIPSKVENRKTYFAVTFSYKDEDEINYNLPKGYSVEFLPKDISIESEFGTYQAKFVNKDNKITYARSLIMNGKKHAPEKYNDLVDFYKKVYQADKQKAVLVKQL